MSNDALRRIHDREIQQRRRSLAYLLALIAVAITVIVALAIAARSIAAALG